MSVTEETIAQRQKWADQKAAKKHRDWREALQKRGNDGYAGDERNVLIALRSAPELDGLVRFNEFALTVEFTRRPPWRDCASGTTWGESDDTALQAWLQAQDLKVRGRSTVADTVVLAAQDHRYHPVRDYFNGLRWDEAPRLTTWLAAYLKSSAAPAYLSVVGLRFMVSAVARIMSPGAQADHMLVIEGPQGIGKTSAARALAVRPEWFAGSLPDIHTKDAPLQLLGRWIIEVAELKAVRNSQIEATKSFITETVDTFRPPYGRRAAQFPRQCVFIATTNESQYLKDRTGNRRYWPVSCGLVDIDGLLRDRDQLWAEAVSEYRMGTAWHITREEAAMAAEEQRERVYVSETEAEVSEYLAKRLEAGATEIAVREVLVYALGLEPADKGYSEAARKLGPAVADALENCGWQKMGRKRVAGSRRTRYQFRGGQGGQGN